MLLLFDVDVDAVDAVVETCCFVVAAVAVIC